MLRLVLVRALVCVGAASVLATTVYAADSAPSSAVNPVIQWNRNLLAIVRTAGAQPATIHPTRSFAIMHAAIYDAVNSIDPDHRPYRVLIEHVSPQASQDAAAAEAAHDVLVDLYPSFQGSLDAQLQQSLQEVPDGTAKTEGVDVGRAVGAAIVALRTDDGSAATPPPFVFDNIPGHYQSTPPNFPKPVFTQWPQVETFVLARADQFRSAPPPSLTSQEYTDVFNEVKAVGIANSTAATPDEALTGRFWNGAIQNYWNEITQTAAIAKRLNTEQSARLFALLNLSLADGVIAFYDSKYTYRFWRPVTAIRGADADGNPQTLADPNWLPEVGKTAADPSYPGAHAVISAASASVLREFFGKDHFHFVVTSEVMPGVTRTFDSFGAAEQEASLSRIFAGVHFRSDEDAGATLGQLVADFVLDHALEAVPRDDPDRP
jgi:membrane-associated phospholipid phosphatase